MAAIWMNGCYLDHSMYNPHIPTNPPRPSINPHRTNLGDLCKFDTEKEEWSIMPLRGQMPPPGYGQSLCV